MLGAVIATQVLEVIQTHLRCGTSEGYRLYPVHKARQI